MRIDGASWTPVVVLTVVVLGLVVTPATGQPPRADDTEPDAMSSMRFARHMPPGVPLTHAAGTVMLSFDYSDTNFDHMGDGTEALRSAEILSEFPVAPTRMTMNMQMVGVMFAATDALTIGVMLPVSIMTMDHVTRASIGFRTEGTGLADTRLQAAYAVTRNGTHRVVAALGVSLPTGSTDVRDDVPAGSDQRLPYPMQRGSGTVDVTPSVSYQRQRGRFGWGMLGGLTTRLGENEVGYRLGHRADASTWLSARAGQWLGHVRLHGQWWGNINGADPLLDPDLVPTADPKRYQGTRLDVDFGVRYDLPGRVLRGLQARAAIVLPGYQSLHGPQVRFTRRVNVGVGWMF